MDYGRVIKDAWNLTWRYRFLWVLGLFAGGGVQSCGSGSGSSYNFNQSDYRRMPPESRQVVDAVGAWVQANAGLLIALVLLQGFLAIALAVVSFIARGGLSRAGADLRRGRLISSSDAWQYGLRFFWRYLGLSVLATLIVIGVLVGLALIGALFFGLASILGGAIQVVVIVLGAIVGFVAVLMLIAFSVGLSLTLVLAQRAIAIEDVGVFEAISRGFRLLVRRLGPTLVFWLLQIVLSIGAFIALAVVLAVVAVPLALLGVLIYALSSGIATPVIVYGVVAFLVFLAAALFASAIVNTFFWHYWTCAYLDLMAPSAPEAVVPPPPTEPYAPIPPTEPTI
jgi:hypothetical protein